MGKIFKVAAKIAIGTIRAIWRDLFGIESVHRSGIRCPECGSKNTEIRPIDNRLRLMCHDCGRVLLE